MIATPTTTPARRRATTPTRRWRRAMLVLLQVAAGGWITAAATEAILGAHALGSSDTGLRRAAVTMSQFIDDEVLVPCALAVTYTGIMLALLTPWGLVRHKWIAVKLTITIVGLIFGTVWLGGWLADAVRATDTGELGPIVPEIIGGWILVAFLVFTLWIGVTKPWGQLNKHHRKPNAEQRQWIWVLALLVPILDTVLGLYGVAMLVFAVGYAVGRRLK